jgi:hypothetical protein
LIAKRFKLKMSKKAKGAAAEKEGEASASVK